MARRGGCWPTLPERLHEVAVNNSGRLVGSPGKIDAFTRMVRERLRFLGCGHRRDYLRALA